MAFISLSFMFLFAVVGEEVFAVVMWFCTILLVVVTEFDSTKNRKVGIAKRVFDGTFRKGLRANKRKVQMLSIVLALVFLGSNVCLMTFFSDIPWYSTGVGHLIFIMTVAALISSMFLFDIWYEINIAEDFEKLPRDELERCVKGV